MLYLFWDWNWKKKKNPFVFHGPFPSSTKNKINIKLRFWKVSTWFALTLELFSNRLWFLSQPLYEWIFRLTWWQCNENHIISLLGSHYFLLFLSQLIGIFLSSMYLILKLHYVYNLSWFKGLFYVANWIELIYIYIFWTIIELVYFSL